MPVCQVIEDNPGVHDEGEIAKAVGMLLAGEGFTSDAYRGLTEKMFGAYPMSEGDSPEGMILHTAGPSGQGW